MVKVLPGPPAIKDLPKDETISFGKKVTISCQVVGKPVPDVTWFRNGVKIIGRRYSTLERGDLVIKDIQFSDEGVYTCLAENIHGNISASGKLIVPKVECIPH